LAGYSMGGAVVTSFLLESPLAVRVRGVILDAPALDLGTVIDNGAPDRQLPILGTPVPPALTEVAKGIAGLRPPPGLGRARLRGPGRAPVHPHAGLPPG